jgi:flavin-dependent dehydrogenase
LYDVIIIGGGLSGLINAILLAKADLSVLLIEKKSYPQQRVCGEYVSNEIKPFLERHDLFPTELEPANITEFQLTSIKGKSAKLPLDLGAFAVSRYRFDEFLYQKAKALGVQFKLNQTVAQVNFQEQQFEVTTRKQQVFQSRLVIGAFGKRSLLDRNLDRAHFKKSSPYIGVKYHVKTDFPKHITALHNFKNGYCGINKIEDDLYNVCYLSHRSNLKQHSSIATMEAEVLQQNPYLKDLFQNSEFVLERPEVINEITFVKKQAVEQHVLMSGDAAGMITPLCGNGMAMAIHAANVLSNTILEQWNQGRFNRVQLERLYTQRWNRLFATRLWAGRQIQSLFGGELVSEVAVSVVNRLPRVAGFLMRQTHGQRF